MNSQDYPRRVSSRPRKKRQIESPPLDETIPKKKILSQFQKRKIGSSVLSKPTPVLKKIYWTPTEESYLWLFTFGIDHKHDSFGVHVEDEYHPLFHRTPKAINDKINAELKKENLFGDMWEPAKQLWKEGTHNWKQIEKKLGFELGLRYISLLGLLEDEHNYSFPKLLKQLKKFEKKSQFRIANKH